MTKFSSRTGPQIRSSEVEQVTHIFSQETGFVTVITKEVLLWGKRPGNSRLAANPGLFSTLFYFITSRHYYLFLAKPRAFWTYTSEGPLLLSEVAKIFFADFLIQPGTPTKISHPTTPSGPKLSLWITPSRPREGPPGKMRGRGGRPEGRPRQPAPFRDLNRR